MTPSNNSFAKKTFSTVSGFTDDSPSVSSNSFSDESMDKGSNAWEGDNLTSGALPGDLISGGAPGVGEFGGIDHFKGRTRPEISH